jgi:DNA sulfur modification protein DndD
VVKVVLCIDPDSFQLSIFNGRGLPVLPDELSAGERQILAFATLNGLAKTAGKKVPTLIDSPLGRLDGVHRDKIATHYFPTAAHQTVIFSTDKEVDNEMWKVLQPSVAHSYRCRVPAALAAWQRMPRTARHTQKDGETS